MNIYWILTGVLIVFTILIFEIPFGVFVNISIDQLFIEYKLTSPLKLRGYAYVEERKVYHGHGKKRKAGNVEVFELFKMTKEKVYVTACHIRGILGDEEIGISMVESVIFDAVTKGFLSYLRTKNQFAKLSSAQHVEFELDKNIFIEASFWLSVLDLIEIGIFAVYSKIKNIFKRRKENGSI